MNLFQLTEVDPIYRKAFGNTDIKQFQVYTAQSEHVGKVVDILSNEKELYYLVVKIGSWLTSKQVLLPLGQFQLDPAAQRIYITGMSKAQIENLPVYNPTESWRKDFRSPKREAIAPLETSVPLEASAPLDTPTPSFESRTSPLEEKEQMVEHSQPTSEVSTERLDTPSYPTAKTVAEETIRLLGERLVVESRKRKIGEVIIRKEVETQIVELPIRREKLIVEQVSPEHRQLASIDLGRGELTGVELAELASSALKPIADGKFISAETARQFLEEVAQQPQFMQTKVQLTFEDTKLQTAYQNWLERH